MKGRKRKKMDKHGNEKIEQQHKEDEKNETMKKKKLEGTISDEKEHNNDEEEHNNDEEEHNNDEENRKNDEEDRKNDEEDRKNDEEDGKNDEEDRKNVVDEVEGIPVVPYEPGTKPGVIFILEKASLEVAKVGKTYQLLNSDEHANFLKRNNRNPADYRPDITHQALLMILDSPLNKAGRLEGVYVRTEKGVLFEIKPNVRIPRTYKRFSGVMLQLLQKLSITAVGKREKLLRVIKNPVTQYLPINSRKIGFSYSSKKLVDMDDYIKNVRDDSDPVFVVGAMAHGKIESDFIEDFISISGYPMSAAFCISRICHAVEKKWKIL